MASEAVSTLVIFIAAVSIAAGVSGAMVTTVGGIAGSLDDRGADLAQKIDTDVEVISDPGSGAVYRDADADSDDEVVLLVKNTGERTVPTDDVDVLLDGRYVPDSEYTVATVGGGDWHDGAVARIVVEASLSGGDHRATVIVGSDREPLRFRT